MQAQSTCACSRSAQCSNSNSAISRSLPRHTQKNICTYARRHAPHTKQGSVHERALSAPAPACIRARAKPRSAMPAPRMCTSSHLRACGWGPIWLVHMRRRSAYGPAGSARHARTQVHGPAPPPVLVAAKARLRFARRPTSQPSQRVPLVARCCNVGASAPLPYPGQSAAPECRTPAAPGQRSCPERPVRRSPCSPSRAVPWHHPADRRWPAAKAKPHRGPAPKSPPPLLGRCGLTRRRRQSQSRGA